MIHTIFIKVLFSFFIFSFLFPITSFAQEIIWKKNFGGNVLTEYNDIMDISGGVIAVGNGGECGFEDLEGLPNHGGADAIVIKYDKNGNVIWKRNFGGADFDTHTSVCKVPDGMVAVGYSRVKSFNNGDWTGITGRGLRDATIVKYNNNGNMIWGKNFGGEDDDSFLAVTAVPDGIVAVGESYEYSFGSGNWEGVNGKGDCDAIIVKYDHNGNLVWKRNFGGKSNDRFKSVTTLSDGVIAVGASSIGSFANGDWEGIESKGGSDAILVKYDFDGNMVWKKNFGGSSGDDFYSVIVVEDGIVAVGDSSGPSMGTGDWTGHTAHGQNSTEATIVKFDIDGNVVWKNNFGGRSWQGFRSVAQLQDGFVAVGWALYNCFDNGDWEGIHGKGTSDAIIVKFDNTGNVVWKKNFGGVSYDSYESVTYVSNSVIAVGSSYCDSFGSSDLEGLYCKGVAIDAIIVRYADGEIGINEPYQVLSEVEVYPNPTTGELRVRNKELRIEGIELFDVYGRKVEGEVRREKGEGEILLDISHLHSGLYIVRIITDAGNVVRKVIKQ